MKSQGFVVCLALAAVLSVACGRHRPTARTPAPPRTGPGTSVPRSVEPGYTEVGYASWYGDPYHGRRAANGEIYDKNQLTAAHLTLPFGTMTKVTNLENDRSVVVRITDRGPFVKGRIIDLSQAAASRVALIGPGTALVRLEVLSAGPNSDNGSFAVQVGAFRDRSNAERLREQLQARYGNAVVENYASTQGLLYRVRVGPKRSLAEAQQLARQLGTDQMETFVVRVDN